MLQMRSFLFFFIFSDEHLCALFQILFSNFLQNKIATFFSHLLDYKIYLTYYAWLNTFLMNSNKDFCNWMFVPWWPSWIKHSIYKIHSRSSDKKFVVIWSQCTDVSISEEDRHQSGSDWLWELKVFIIVSFNHVFQLP